MLASDKTLMAETNSSGGSSSSNRFITTMSANQEEQQGTTTSSQKMIQMNFVGSNNNNEEINNNNNRLNHHPVPVSPLAASPSSCSLNKLSSVCCSKLELTNEKKKYCMACIGKWVSDVSEMEDFNVSNLITYLRMEFQSVHFTKTEEKLRVLEEESVLEARESKSLEAELRVVKDKCSELSLKLWNSESSKTDVEIDLKNCKLECRGMREKVGKLEKALASKDRELAQLKMRCRDLERSKNQEKGGLELELEPDISLNQYLRKVKSASKVKVEEQVKGKAKSKALVEIGASGSQVHRKRGRKSLNVKNNTEDKGSDELVNVKPEDNKDTEGGLAEIAAMSEIMEEKGNKKQKVCDSEASGKHGMESNEGAVGEAVGDNVEHLDAPHNEKISGKAKVEKGVPSNKVYPPGCASCHQCKRVDRGEIITCAKCKRRYCLLCIQKRYPELSHGEIEKSCPACQGFCNCSACLRKIGKNKLKLGSEQHGQKETDALQMGNL